jgi:hypothetical protein
MKARGRYLEHENHEQDDQGQGDADHPEQKAFEHWIVLSVGKKKGGTPSARTRLLVEAQFAAMPVGSNSGDFVALNLDWLSKSKAHRAIRAVGLL